MNVGFSAGDSNGISLGRLPLVAREHDCRQARENNMPLVSLTLV